MRESQFCLRRGADLYGSYTGSRELMYHSQGESLLMALKVRTTRSDEKCSDFFAIGRCPFLR
jgi:hypothetical protein